MQFENGLTLRPVSDAAAPPPAALWHYSFDKLLDSSDNNRSLVQLNFGKGELQVSGGVSAPRAVRCLPPRLSLAYRCLC